MERQENIIFVTYCNIGVGRFRILGGQRLEHWKAKGRPNSQQAHDVVGWLFLGLTAL